MIFLENKIWLNFKFQTTAMAAVQQWKALGLLKKWDPFSWSFSRQEKQTEPRQQSTQASKRCHQVCCQRPKNSQWVLVSKHAHMSYCEKLNTCIKIMGTFNWLVHIRETSKWPWHLKNLKNLKSQRKLKTD